MCKFLHNALLALVAIICLCMSGCGVVSPADKKIAQADQFLKNGNYIKASQKIDAAIAQDPKRSDTYTAAMQAYDSHGRRVDSARVCSRFVQRAIAGKLDRKLHRVEIAQWAEVAATSYHQANIFPEAESHYLIALKQDPNNAMARNDLGYLYAENDTKLDEALMLTSQAVRSIPNDGNVLDSLGWVYYKRHNYKLAAEALRQAVALCPDVPEIRYHLGATYIAMGRLMEARIELRKALALNPGITAATQLLSPRHK